MNISQPFILRPIATSLVMAAVLLAGGIAYYQLPVAALPEVEYPTVQIVTFYPGANPDVMGSSVTAPLERQFGQVSGLKQMTSTSSFGSSLITLQFALDLDIDVAEQEVQAAINAASSYLPADLPNPPVYSKVNPADAPVLTMALTSKTLPLPKVEDLADTELVQKMSQLPGVGLVKISGGQKPGVRIRANPTELASYGLGLEDIRAALVAASVDQAKGNFESPYEIYTIGANDQILKSSDYQNIIVAYRNGAPVRLSEVATVSGRRRKHQAGCLDERSARRNHKHSAAAGRQYDRRGRSHKGPLTATPGLFTAVGRDLHTDGPHSDDSSLGRRRSIRIVAHHRSCRISHLPVSPQPCRNSYTGHCGSLVASGCFRPDVRDEIQRQQSDPDGDDDIDGVRC